MPIAAVLFDAPPAPGMSAAVIVGGIGVLDRQLRQVRAAGVTKVFVVGGSGPDRIVDAAALASTVGGYDVLLLDPGVVFDMRIVAAAAAATAPAIAVWPTGHAGIERIDTVATAAGIALYPGALVCEIAAGLGEWDLTATLLRAALTAGATRIELAALPVYAAELRRDVPLIWARPDDADSAAEATAALLAATHEGCRDWPARFVHPPIENAAVRLLLPTPVTPGMIIVLVVAIALGAGVAFACGRLWIGLILALLFGAVSRIDRTLASVRLDPARLGQRQTVERALEYGWYLAIAAHFAAIARPGAWAVAALVIGFALADAVQRGFYFSFAGRAFDDAGRFERRFSLVAARRNTLLWAWLPFAAFGLWYAGFAVLAGYATLSFFVAQVRVFRRIGEQSLPAIGTVAGNG